MKRGPGFRSSFSGTIATVFGASGLVGCGVCNRLGKNGTQMILPYRGDHYKMMRLKVCGDLGQVLFTPYHLKDEESIRKSMLHSNVVINLVGREWPTKNFSLEDVNVTGPARIARIAAELGVKRFVQISAINAREQPQRAFMPNPSPWLRTKWEGERAVLAAFPDATIIRASDIWGQGDSFLFHYFGRAGRYGRKGRHMPLYKKGEKTVIQPVSMSDVTSGIMAVLADPDTKGKTFEALGPDRFLLSEFMDYCHDILRKDYIDWGYRRTDLFLDPWPFIQSFLNQSMPFGTIYFGSNTIDKLERTSLSDESEGFPNLRDLGIEPASIIDDLHWQLFPLRAFAHFEPMTEAQMADLPPIRDAPKSLTRLQEKALIAEKESSSLIKFFGIS